MKTYFNLALPAIAAVLFTLVSCGKKHDGQTVAPVRVDTMVVAPSQTATGRSYSGVIEESSGTVLSFKVPGTISRMYVGEGQRVASGQLIAELDGASLHSNLQIAEAALATAQDTYDRMRVLHESRSIPDMRWVEVENALKAAQSTAQIARNAVGDTRLYAPFGGYISQKLADAGSTVAPAVPVVKLVEISPVKINISVSEDEISDISDSTRAMVSVAALGGRRAEAALSEKGVAADPLSRSYSVKFICDNADGAMLPGMLCTVTLSSESSRPAIVIPVEAVMLDASNQSYVWTVADGRAVKRDISLGSYTADGVTVDSGLEAGDAIIVRGMQKVSAGLEVEPIN